jgi:hypothetical protein
MFMMKMILTMLSLMKIYSILHVLYYFILGMEKLRVMWGGGGGHN